MDVPAWVREARGSLRQFLDEVWHAGPDGALLVRQRVYRWRKRLAARGIDLGEVVEWKQERRVYFLGRPSNPREVKVWEIRVKWRGLSDSPAHVSTDDPAAPTVSTGEPAGVRGRPGGAAQAADPDRLPRPCTFLRFPTGAVVTASEASAR